MEGGGSVHCGFKNQLWRTVVLLPEHVSEIFGFQTSAPYFFPQGSHRSFLGIFMVAEGSEEGN